MQAPCARYCSIGCAASPSSVMRPRLQSLIGGRSQSTHMRQLSILARSARTGAQRIKHEMHFLAGPDDHVAPAVPFRNFRGWQNRAIGNMAGGLGLAVADDELADRRP